MIKEPLNYYQILDADNSVIKALEKRVAMLERKLNAKRAAESIASLFTKSTQVAFA